MRLTVGFIGLGLIGGSVAKAIRRFHPDSRIIAYNRSLSVLETANQKVSLTKSASRWIIGSAVAATYSCVLPFPPISAI